MAVKVTVIGAGSLGFTRELMSDMLAVPELQDATLSFMDIDRGNLSRVTKLIERDIKHNKVGATITATMNRREALEGADYVYNLTRIGRLEAFKTDIEIPLKYGVDQCVGDTLCIGGIMYGQRNAAAILDFCKDIREVAKPNALFLNYANPMAMNTWVANTYGGVNTIGLCHGVEGGQWQIAKVIESMINKGKKEGDKGFKAVTRKDVDIICAGINHQTWYIQALYKGRDWTDRLLKGFSEHPVYSKTEKIRIDMLKRFGYYTTESNGHVSEYVPWYRKRTKDIHKWIARDSWVNGETGGYLRVCTEGQNWFKTDFPALLKADPAEYAMEKRGSEHGSYIIESLETGRAYRGHFNVPNKGCITNLTDDAIVEVPCYVDGNGVSVPRVGDLPLGCAAICDVSVNVQRLSVEAAVHGDVTLLKQAAMMDPLTGAVCDPNEISQMVDEMLVAQAKWLPQYRKDIPKAKARLKSEKPLGTRKTQGAARKKTKSVADMRKNAAEARRNAQSADKAAGKRKEQARKGKV